MNEVLFDMEVETPEGPLEIKVWRSERDGAVVVSVDTPNWEDGYDGPDMGPQLRLWLNDALLHHGVEIPNHELTD